jgi:hypothetical protein
LQYPRFELGIETDMGKASSAHLKASQLALRIGAKIIDFLRHSSFASCLYMLTIYFFTSILSLDLEQIANHKGKMDDQPKKILP